MGIDDLIMAYFPEGERQRAECIAVAEWQVLVESPPSRLIDILALMPMDITQYVRDEALVDCGQGQVRAVSYGPFALVDACWDPSMNPVSIFTQREWDLIKSDMEWHVWGAAKVWSNGGWRAWTTCQSCDACAVTGGPIPYPRAPIGVSATPAMQRTPIVVAAGGLAGLVVLGILDSQ